MKILFLTAHLPYPPFSGGRRREFELISKLSKRFDIHLCSITKSLKTDSVYADDLLQYCTTVKLFECCPTDNQQYVSYPHQMKKYISEEATSYVSALLKNQRFDLAHVEGYYLLQHVPVNSGVPIVLVEHNVEHLLALQRFLLATTHKEKSYFWSEYVKTLEWEKLMWKRATVCIALTREDKNSIEQREPSIDVRMIPNGSDHHQKIIEHASSSNGFRYTSVIEDRPSILFVGNFAYEPNVDAALYFSQYIFPLILKDAPNVKLYLVGNAPPPEIRSLTSNRQIRVTGQVDSVIPFYKEAQVVVCPLRIGGGVKVKVLEALCLGKAIVSTSVGAQGLDLWNYRAVTVADEASDFAEKVIQLLLHPQKRRMQEKEALAYARTLPTWDQASDAFARLYEEIADRRVTNTEEKK
ncbi:MAG: glycosyltransferase family 4 protein [Thermoproteota archaeon]|nr:glycosyltransferase family 4 protein [Thermoproteota archaeon]